MRVVLGRLRHHAPDPAGSHLPAGHRGGGHAAVRCGGSGWNRLWYCQSF